MHKKNHKKGAVTMKFGRVDRNLMETNHQRQKEQDAARIARNAYLRDWRANNRDKVRQYNQNYWARKAEREGRGA